MMIYTSYFGKLRQLPKDIVPIAICGKSPDWYDGLEYKRLAPKYKSFMQYKQDHDTKKYTENYYEDILRDLLHHEALLSLMRMSKGKDVCLLCYEKPGEFCHRHIVAKWFNNYGIKCQEYEFK